MSQRGRGAGRWLFAILVLAAGGGGYYWWTAQQAKAREAAARQAAQAPRPVAVSVSTAAAGRFEVQLDGLGTVSPINTVVVRSRVDGQMEEVFFKEGQTVAKGDLLLRIDRRPFQAAVDQARAKLAQDQALLKNANADLQRYSTLAKSQFASRQQVDTQTANVASQTALTQADQAALDNALVQLGYTEIRAPIAGRIGFRQVDPGNIVRAADAQGLLSIVQMDPINVLYTLPEGQLASVERAIARGPVSVRATVVGQRVTPTVEGVVSVVNNQVDQASGTVQIKAEFANPKFELWPGQAVTTRTRVDTLDDVVVVRPSVVQHGPNGLFIWTVKGDQAESRPVTVGEQDSGGAVITKGLAVGDRYVTAGQLRLRNGVKVDAKDGPPNDQQASAGGATQ